MQRTIICLSQIHVGIIHFSTLWSENCHRQSSSSSALISTYKHRFHTGHIETEDDVVWNSRPFVTLVTPQNNMDSIEEADAPTSVQNECSSCWFFITGRCQINGTSLAGVQIRVEKPRYEPILESSPIKCL